LKPPGRGAHATDRALLASLLAAAAGLYAMYWAWTDWILEDALILGRIARNFAEHGILSFHPERSVSSATSPLYVAALGVLTRLGADPLVASRLLGIAATLGVGIVLFVLAKRQLPARHAVTAAAPYLLLPTTAAYSICGLETPVYTLSCVLTLSATIAGRNRAALSLGALAAVLRPDGLIVLAVAGLAALVQARRLAPGEIVRSCLPAAAILGVCAAAHYAAYGSLLPQTLVAKSLAYHVDPLTNALNYLHRMLLAQPAGLPVYALAAAGAIGALRANRSLGWLLLWYVLYHVAFMWRAALFGWYLQPPVPVVLFFAGFALARLLVRLEQAASNRWPGLPGFRFAVLALLGVTLAATPMSCVYGRAKLRSRTYERSVREAAGRWLDRNTDPQDLVFTESLGFIGYYNRNRFVDWPGLVDPDVPELIVGLNRTEGFLRIIEQKSPVYLALRDHEWERLRLRIEDDYAVVTEFPNRTGTRWSGYKVARRKP